MSTFYLTGVELFYTKDYHKAGVSMKKVKRERFTTSINPDLIDRLKIFAIKKKVKFNVLLENIIFDYLESMKGKG